ncbi:DNA cytosine methyltransferase [Neorhizobium huautlense]|uniref:DNA cytosine methyltransferase n=1 Tax=Neorhizobium huautlense TaxID=67774 RepID=UPI000CFA42E2|nr:DNA cytosine methyltransferase [Neorhizobium huautlense]
MAGSHSEDSERLELSEITEADLQGRTDVDATLRQTRIRILQNRRQLVTTLAALAKDVDELLSLPDTKEKRAETPADRQDPASVYNKDISTAQVTAHLLETGLTPRDLKLLRGFSKKLYAHRTLLIANAVHFDTIAALISSNKRTRAEGLARISAGATLTRENIKEISKEFRRISTSENERQHLAYRGRLTMRASEIAKEKVEVFRTAVSKFLNTFKKFHHLSRLLPTQREDWEAMATAFSFDPDHIETMHTEVVEEAKSLWLLFNEIFPEVGVPSQNWGQLQPDSADLLLAKAHFILQHCSYGDFSYLTSEISSFLKLDGISTLRLLCERPDFSPTKVFPINDAEGNLIGTSDMPPPANLDEIDEKNPIRRFTAVEIFSSCGAGALGLEAASFYVAAVCDENPQAQRAISANRPDWGIADTMTWEGIREAIPAKLKGKRIDVVCGAIPGRPWERKQGGAADSRNELPKVLSLLADIQPDGIFFEISEDFRSPRNVLYHDQLIQDLSDLGYLADIYRFDGEQCGLGQKRRRAVIIGVKRSLNRPLIPPLIHKPVQRSLDSVLRKYLQREQAYAVDRVTYDKWNRVFGHSTKPALSPDLHTILNSNSPVLRKWRDVGFECDYLLTPNKRRRRDEDVDQTVRINIPVLKALQGIPVEWELTGTELEQCEQVCATIPPAIMRVLAQAMHAILMGQPVDLSASIDEPIKKAYQSDLWVAPDPDTGKRFRKPAPYGLRPIHLHDDPAQEVMRRYRIEQEIERGPFDQETFEETSKVYTRPTAAIKQLARLNQARKKAFLKEIKTEKRREPR